MTSKNLEEKTQEERRQIAEMDVVLMEFFLDLKKAKHLNPFRKKGYENSTYGEKKEKYGDSYGS